LAVFIGAFSKFIPWFMVFGVFLSIPLYRNLKALLGVILCILLGYIRAHVRTMGTFSGDNVYEVYIFDAGKGYIVGKGFYNIMFGNRMAYPISGIFARGEFKGDTFVVEDYVRILGFKPFISFVDQKLIKSTHSEKQYEFAKAVITGVRDIDRETKKMFYDTGTGHILAISGLHVGIIFLGISFLLRFLRFGNLSLLISSFIVWIYAFFVGFIPSVVRASIMLTLYSLSKLVSRPVKPINVFFLAFGICILWEPLWIFSPSFWLSFSAIYGFILLPKNILTSIFGASIFSTPFALYFFGKSALLTLPVNLLVIPIMTLFLYSQILAILIGYPFTYSAELMFNILYNIVKWTYNLNLPLIEFKFPAYLLPVYVILLSTVIILYKKYANKTA